MRLLNPLTGQFEPFESNAPVLEDVEYTSTTTIKPEPPQEDDEIPVRTNFDFMGFQTMLKDAVQQRRFSWELDHDGKRKRKVHTFLTLTTLKPIPWRQRNLLLDALLSTYQFDDVEYTGVNQPIRKRDNGTLQRFYRTTLALS